MLFFSVLISSDIILILYHIALTLSAC